MRKNRKQQKNQTSQLNIFDRMEEKPDENTTSGIGKSSTTGDELSSLLERERALTENIMERIIDHVNLNKAFHQVVGNHGASGTDGMEIDSFKQWYP